MKKLTASLATAVLLSGCATTAQPNLYNGNYYLSGDSNCTSFRQESSTRVGCFNKKGIYMGSRYAMTPQEMQMYQMQLANQQLQAQAFNQSMQQLNQSLQQTNQQIQQQNQQFVPPQVTPITPPGGNQTLCLVNGGYISCRSK